MQHFQYYGACGTGQQSHGEHTQRDRGQDQMLEATIAEAGKPAQDQGEHVHQHEPEPKHGDRQARDGKHHRQGIDPAADLHRRQETQRHTQEHSEQHGRQSQLQGRPEALCQHHSHGLAAAKRGAQVKLGQLRHVLAKAHMNRIAQAKLLVHALQHLRIHDIAAVCGSAGGEGAWHDAEDEENQQRNGEQDRHHLP